MKRRIFTLLLAALMLVSVLPLTAFAAPIYVDQGIRPTAINSFWDSIPTADEDGNVTFYNNWTVGRYAFESGLYELYDELADPKYKIIGVDADGYIWSNGGGMYSSGVLAIGDASYGNWNKNTCSAQFQYTATHNGTVKFSLNRFRFHDESATKPATTTVHFQLCVNGKKVWPADSEWYTYTNNFELNIEKNGQDCDVLDDFLSKANFPGGLEVKMGDTVDFRVKREAANMVIVSPAVQYTAVKDTPEISRFDVTVGEGLAMNMYVALDPNNTREGAKAGLYYWTKKPAEMDVSTARQLTGAKIPGSNLTKFVYEDITAVDMSKELWVLPYTYVEGSDDYYFGRMQLCSLAEYAKRVYNDPATDDDTKNFVRELVNYGANAELFFGADNDIPSNDFLDAADRESDDLTGTDIWAQFTDGTTGVNIALASLLLDEKVGLKFVAPIVDGISSYKMEIATKSDFSDKVDVAMTKTQDGKGYKGIYYIGLGDITTTYYVRVTDGNGYGNTLVYSAESYITRRSDVTESDEEWYLLGSLLALGYATDALE